MFSYAARLHKVVDGDTVELIIDLGFSVSIKERFRLSYINAPEMNTEAGKAAKTFVEQWFSKQATIEIHSQKKPQREKWQRYLGIIYGFDANELPTRLNDELIKAGHAVEAEY